MIGNAQPVTMMMLAEEPNLLQNLRLAEQHQDWEAAQAILRALGEVYLRLNRRPEFKTLRQRALRQIGTALAEANTDFLNHCYRYFSCSPLDKGG
jgi:hypothetical protein